MIQYLLFWVIETKQFHKCAPLHAEKKLKQLKQAD